MNQPTTSRRSTHSVASQASSRTALPDMRPRTPADLAWIGGGLLLAGALFPSLSLLGVAGLVCLAVAALAALSRPHPRSMYWRGRRIDLDDTPASGRTVYRRIFRGSV